MREITLKYSGECRKCGATLPTGGRAIYERHVGVFCLECGPTDPEDIRAYRQEGADRKAERYDAWATKREAVANATLKHNRDHYTGDIAFCTQPGHIPLRARVIRQDDKARESLNVAHGMRDKAARLSGGVRVKGDAARRDQAKRDAIRPLLEIGMKVSSGILGTGLIERINKKTARVGHCGRSGTYSGNIDLAWLKIVS
jgi:hypothetical protein